MLTGLLPSGGVELNGLLVGRWLIGRVQATVCATVWIDRLTSGIVGDRGGSVPVRVVSPYKRCEWRCARFKLVAFLAGRIVEDAIEQC